MQPAHVRVIRHSSQTNQWPRCDDCFNDCVIATTTDSQEQCRNWYVNVPGYCQISGRHAAVLANWMIQCGRLIQSSINLMRDRLLSYDITAIDKSRYQVLKERGKQPKADPMYGCSEEGHPINRLFFTITTQSIAKRAGAPARCFKRFLQTDAYKGYGPVCRKNNLVSGLYVP